MPYIHFKGTMVKEYFEEKPYLTDISISDARTNFRIRSKMVDVKWNTHSDKHNQNTLWKCGNVNLQSHIIWCPYFASLREGKSLDSDLTW